MVREGPADLDLGVLRWARDYGLLCLDRSERSERDQGEESSG